MNPATGEALALDATDEELARALYEARDLVTRLHSFKTVIGDELLVRLDKRAKWSGQVGPYKLKASSPAPRLEYDAAELASVLDLFVERGVIQKEAAEAAVETIVDFKARKNGINALLKLGGELAEAIKTCEHAVQISRSAPGVEKVA